MYEEYSRDILPKKKKNTVEIRENQFIKYEYFLTTENIQNRHFSFEMEILQQGPEISTFTCTWCLRLVYELN